MASENAGQHGPADATAVNTLGTADQHPADQPHGPAEGPDAAARQTFFVTPAALAEHIQAPSHIPFYRPTQGHTLTPDACYAVRLNEPYEDFKAAAENERAYVRQAIFKAQELTFYRCVQKHPILIMRNFAPQDIKDGGKRAVDCAVNRCVIVRPKGKQAFQIDDSAFCDHKRYRITGPTDVLQDIASTAGFENHFHVKASHVQGASVAHAYYTEEEAKLVGEHALITEISTILTSEKANHQVTLRGTLTCDEVLTIGLTLQKWDCSTTFRTYGTLRVTFRQEVTGEVYKKIKETFPNLSVFTDTPINAWADGQPRLPKGTVRSKAVTTAQDDGMQVARFSCDSVPHPNTFKLIAALFNGSVMEILDDKYNSAPMACLMTFSPRSWTELNSSVDITDLFTVNGANWQITPIRSKKRV